MSENYRKINLKRKVFSKGKRNFKRFKKTPKFVKDNPENKIAKEKERDAYYFTDSESEVDDDFGMGIGILDLPALNDDQQKDLIALTQDTVRPLFTEDSPMEEGKLEEALAELKHSSFRLNQKETVKRILYGRSTLFVSPTGSGKSLCYQLPALLYWRYRKYMTIVVSPLISLMDDQMRNFPASLKAVSLHSGHNQAQRRRSIQQLVEHEAQVAFISPEAIVGGILNVEDLKNLPPVGFVCIDEAHCLSEWSHNFRPAYQQFFNILSEKMNIKTYLGLTATATKATSVAIARHLSIHPETDIIGSTKIPDNLILSVSYESNKEKAIIDLLKSPTFKIMTSIIVYCNRREETDHLASRIRTAMQSYATLIEVPERSRPPTALSLDDSVRSNGSNSSSSSDKSHMKLTWHAESYHAGLSKETRKRIQRQFIKGEIRVVVATIAFGMGINKANVRAIIHYDMPSSFESYVQEIGRAGRDGKPAQCHMFLKADKTDLFYQQRNIYASVTERKNLGKLVEYIFPECRCKLVIDKEESKEFERLNKSDSHVIENCHRIIHTEKTVQRDKETINHETDSTRCNDENRNICGGGKENRHLVQDEGKSVVRKHRPCKGHEVAFDIEKVTNDINLKPESIITLICQLQRAYPQLRIKQFTPIKSTCNLFCYHGATQMEALAVKSKPVFTALVLHRTEHSKNYGSRGETPNRLSFDVVKVAKMLGRPSSEIIQDLKKNEWELVDEKNRFRRTQVRVNFEGNSFHLQAVGDLDEKEIEEVSDYLYGFTRMYEDAERDKILKVFNTFKRHCIEVERMKDKDIRLETSSRLKAALDAYFDLSSEHQQVKRNAIIEESQNHLNETIIGNSEDNQAKLDQIKEQSARKRARAFLSAHGTDYTARTIARIFQGISTPNYPSETWGMNSKWWRTHLDIDFLRLTSIIKEELLR